MKRRTKSYIAILVIIWIVTAALNAAAFRLPGFSDWYIDHITPVWNNTYARFSNIFSFSFGEILITAGVLLAASSVISLILLIFLFIRRRYRRFVARLMRFDLAVITIVCLLMTLNCSILYKAAPMPQSSKQYSIDELYSLCNHIVEKCNEYSLKMDRDENGLIVYEGDLNEVAKAALTGLSDKYPRLSGFYPKVKPMMYSHLMSQGYMAGYYFPFSMEANINKDMYISNLPASCCHELAHLHGYIYEDEANYLAFLACISSDDDFFVYSGYLSVLNYAVNALYPYKSLLTDEQNENLLHTSKLVDTDNIFLTREMWDKVEKNAVLSTETVSNASTAFTDTTLKAAGVSDGMASYSRVVALLLNHYDGELY